MLLENNGNYWDHCEADFLHDPANGSEHPERKYVRELIKELYPSKKPTLLDIPCGSGVDIQVLKDVSIVTGADKTPHMLELVTKHLPETNTLLTDIREINANDNAFDVVYARAIFEHLPSIEDVALAMKECFRVAKHQAIYSFYLPLTAYQVKNHGEFYENTYSMGQIESILELLCESWNVRCIEQEPGFTGAYTVFTALKLPNTTEPPKEADQTIPPVQVAPKRRGRKPKVETV